MSELFFRSAAAYPERPALHLGERTFSYGELQAMTEIVFGQLARYPVPAFIGLYCDESAWTYASILAICSAGACYVPLNPRSGTGKMMSIAADIPLRLIVTPGSLPFETGAEVMTVDRDITRRMPCTTLVRQPYAYLLYTSGSTGDPKGVPVSFDNIRHFLEYYQESFGFDKDDRFLQPYELSFDMSVFAIFSGFKCGGCVFVVPGKGFRHFNLLHTLATHRITVSTMVPNVLALVERYLPAFSFPSLRLCFFAGDRLYHGLASGWQQCAPGAEIYNSYGPTETTIVCTGYNWTKNAEAGLMPDHVVPLGKPFPGMEYLLIDESGNEIKHGHGELCFHGPQVIAHYLHKRYEQSFFLHHGKRFYRTGDLSSVDSSGDLIFHGRTDGQFKIGGYRVETAEIENAIIAVTGKLAVVLPFHDAAVVKIVVFTECDVSREVLQGLLEDKLAEYMMPHEVIYVPELPRGLSDKVDRAGLKIKYHAERSGN